MHYEKFCDGTVKCIQKKIPFEIPDNWAWTRFRNIIVNDKGGGTPDKSNPKYWGGSIQWMSVKDFSGAKNGVIVDTIDHVTQEGVNNSSTNIIDTSAIILCTRMGLGKYAKLAHPTAINQDLRAIWLSKNIHENYFLAFYSTLNIDGNGTTVEGIKKEQLLNTLIPIPPFKEQARIANIQKTGFSEIEIIENQKIALCELINNTKSKILDLAIRGKLVSQDPNDEPASALLERIRHEKEELIKVGKLKRDKRESVIFRGEDNSYYEKFGDGSIQCIDEHILFEIPKSWAWVRLKNVTINRDKERKPISLRDRTKVKKIYDYYGASGIIDKIDNYIFSEKLLLIGEDGENLIARSKPLAFFADGKYWVNNHAHCIDATDKQILEFICVFINAISIEPFITGSAQPKLTQDKLNSILVPIPPEKEQSAISKKIKQLYSVLDSINFSLL